MKDLLSYSTLFPDLPLEAILYFSEHDEKNGIKNFRNILDFCLQYQSKHNLKDLPQPKIVAEICNLMCKYEFMTLGSTGGLDNMQNTYYSTLGKVIIENKRDAYILQKKINYSIFGFKYIYEDTKNFVLPIEFTDSHNNKSLGTGFLFQGGFVTAKHCIENAKNIAIKNIDCEDLKAAKFIIHNNPYLDLLFIPKNLKRKLSFPIPLKNIFLVAF